MHRALGPLPDLTYVLDRRGLVAGRVLWSNDARGLERIVRAVAEDREPDRATSYASLVPLVRGLGTISPVLGAAGRAARRDLLITAPPLYLLARVASLFRPLPPLGRGGAALALVIAATWTMWSLARRRTRGCAR